MDVRYKVINIGALSCNRMWAETTPRRAAHATCTLIRSGSTTILVDPSLPTEAMVHRLDERAGLTLNEIDVVFLTTFRPVHRRALASFERASWVMHAPEIEAVRTHLAALNERAAAGRQDPETVRLLRDEQMLVEKIETAPDRLTEEVHLFPAMGASVGSAALLLAEPSRTIVVAGDAVLTEEHFEAGRVFEQAASVEDARSAFREIAEIADEIVPGHDNAFRVRGRWGA